MNKEEDEDLKQFDLFLKKKKKKKNQYNENKENKENKENVENVENVENEDYDYTNLLDRLYSELRTNHPNLVSRKKIIVPCPQLARMGKIKTMVLNFNIISLSIHRQPDHIRSFFSSELKCDCSIDANIRLIIKGRYVQNQIESIFKNYITNYVSCHMCQTHDTILIKDQITRLYFLQCDLCGSKRSV
jgi:translation initiation factor 2 subunit 2